MDNACAEPGLHRPRILAAAAALGLEGSDPGGLGQLLSLLCGPDGSAEAISAAIERHPVLCARVLRVANSAYYGQVRATRTVRQALLLLGLEAVRGIAAAVCMSRALPARGKSPLIDMRALMRHSLATAIASQYLARGMDRALAAEAFLAGLIHNLGVAIQACVDESGILAMLQKSAQEPLRDIRSLESRNSLVHHEDCGAIVFESWNLPETLVTVAAHHHRPSEAPPVHRQLAELVHAGASVAVSCGLTFALEPSPRPDSLELMHGFAVDGELAAELQSTLQQKVSDLHGVIAED